MKISITKGFAFGITSGVITTLGLIVGLDSSTHSQIVVLSGILTIAIADAFSDSLGIHVAQEAEKRNSEQSVWESTAATFFSKFFVAISFIAPVLLLNLNTAIVVSIIWGMFLIGIFSYYIAKHNKAKISSVVLEHVGIALCVIIIAHFVGDAIAVLLK